MGLFGDFCTGLSLTGGTNSAYFAGLAQNAANQTKFRDEFVTFFNKNIIGDDGKMKPLSITKDSIEVFLGSQPLAKQYILSEGPNMLDGIAGNFNISTSDPNYLQTKQYLLRQVYA